MIWRIGCRLTGTSSRVRAVLWTVDEIRWTLAGIDRQSVTGKRDYAMILTTARLGLRISDLRRLELGDLGWRAKQITIVQHKTAGR